jgi:hypothetical protein
MKFRMVVLAASLFLAGCAGPGGGRAGGPPLRASANPGGVVAAELALARAVREQGDYKAYLDAGASDAITFLPEPRLARDVLRGTIARDDVASWKPYRVWSSCDGSLAATIGGWTKPDGTFGSFFTLWQRDDRGTYKWVLDHAQSLSEPLEEPDMVQADVADCGSGQQIAVEQTEGLSVPGKGNRVARDGTLAFEWTIDGDLSRHLILRMIKDGAPREQLSLVVPAPGSES